MAYKIKENCTCCGTCFKICPVGAISQGEQMYKINPELCINCGSCAAVCPVAAPIEEK